MTDACQKCGGWLAVENILANYEVDIEVRCVNCGWYRLHPQLRPRTIDSIAEGFLRAGVRFLIVASGAGPLHRAWSDYQQMPRTPILGDPCGRLHRSFGVAESEPLSRCRTFVIDGAGVLRLQFMHDFTDHALAAIRQLVTKNRLSFAKSVPASEIMIGEAEHVI